MSKIKRFAIKIKGTIEIFEKVKRVKPKKEDLNKKKIYNKNTTIDNKNSEFIECSDEFIQKIIRNGGL